MTKKTATSIWDPQIIARAVGGSLRKLNPGTMARNPVMFVVEVGSVLTTAQFVLNAVNGRGHFGFELQVVIWLCRDILLTTESDGALPVLARHDPPDPRKELLKNR